MAEAQTQVTCGCEILSKLRSVRPQSCAGALARLSGTRILQQATALHKQLTQQRGSANFSEAIQPILAHEKEEHTAQVLLPASKPWHLSEHISTS